VSELSWPWHQNDHKHLECQLPDTSIIVPAGQLKLPVLMAMEPWALEGQDAPGNPLATTADLADTEFSTS
jgi:hypothetical protein